MTGSATVPPVGLDRVVEVDAARRGSGLAVGPDLVLTAGHVVGDVDAICRVRVAGENAPVAASVVWRGIGGVDAALLRLDTAVWPGLIASWGMLAAVRPVECRAAGYPWVQKQSDGMRVEEVIAGTVVAGTGHRLGRYGVNVATALPYDLPGGRSSWRGMSGAGLTDADGRCVLGVLVADPQMFEASRLEAVPAAVLLADSGFVDLVAGGGVGPVAEPVDLPGVFAASPVAKMSAAGLLRAELGVVRFRGRGRADLLDRLVGWCGTGGGLGVRLLVGLGGQGKTRLMAELAARMRAQGWVAGQLADTTAVDAVAGLVGLGCPVLVVVDYAEARPDLVAALVDVLAGLRVPARLVLVGRAAGEWVGNLAARTPGLAVLAGAPVDELAPVEPPGAGRVDAWGEAVTDLAAGLSGVPGYGGVDWAAVAAAVAGGVPAGLTGTRFDTMLSLHMQALAALVQAGLPVDGVGVGPEGVLLLHEQRYWTRVAAAWRLGLTEGTLRRAVAATTVWSAADQAEASTVMDGLPGVRDLGEDRRMAVSGWLSSLYPAPGGWWGSVQPDRLAEHLVADVLAVEPGLLDSAAGAASAGQVHHALTVLSRAAVHHGSVAAGVARLVQSQPHRVGPVAVTVATETENPTPLLDALAVTVDEAGDDAADLLAALDDAVPHHTQVHREFAVKVSGRLVAIRRTQAAADPSTSLPDLAASLNTLSVRLSEVGRREEGLTAIEEAVTIRRRLATARPDAFLRDLAMSLNNLAVDLGDLGRREEGLAAIEEAVTIRRRLAAARPDAFLPNLAGSLINLSTRLGEVGRREEGLAASEEAVSVYRRLATARPDAFLPNLALSLNNLSIRLADLGRREEGLAASEEAVSVYRRLATARPDAFLPNLALSLSNLSIRLADLGRREEGLIAIEEAVTIRRRLATARPDAFLPDLAGSLNTLSVRLGDLGRREEGLAAIEEAVTIRRRLAAARPDAFLPNLAGSLNNLSINLGEVGRREEGLAAIEEAVSVYRRLAADRPDAFLPNLATSLNNLSNRLGEAGRRDEGVAASEEAVAVDRGLAVARPDAFLPNLAGSLNNLSNRLGEAGRREEGLAAIEEAVSVYRRLAADRPDAFLPNLATSLNNLSNRLADLGRHEEAASVQREADAAQTLIEERLRDRLVGRP